jgi:hypothetical protein
MDIFNRPLVAVLALGTLTAAVVVFLVAGEIASPGDLAPHGWLQDQLREIDELGGGRTTATIASVVAAGVVAIVLLVLEPLPLLTTERLVVADAAGKDFGIYGDSIKLLIEGAGKEIEGVTGVTPSFRKTAEGLRITCRARLAPSANMPEVGTRLQDKVKAAVEGLAGVRVAEVRVKLRYDVAAREQRVS